MAFADVLRSNLVNTADVATLVEKLLARSYVESLGSTTFVGNDTWNDMTSGLSVPVLAGEIVVLYGQINLSVANAAGAYGTKISRAAVDVTSPTYCYNPVGSVTSGYASLLTTFGVDTPGAGTFTYKLKALCSGGGATAYSMLRQVNAIVLRTS